MTGLYVSLVRGVEDKYDRMIRVGQTGTKWSVLYIDHSMNTLSKGKCK